MNSALNPYAVKALIVKGSGVQRHFLFSFSLFLIHSCRAAPQKVHFFETETLGFSLFLKILTYTQMKQFKPFRHKRVVETLKTHGLKPILISGMKATVGLREPNMGTPYQVTLPDNLTIATAENLYNDLSQYAQGGKDVEFEAKGVQRVDTAGLQILYVFMKTLAEHETKVIWKSTSDCLLQTSEQLGLTEALALQAA